MCLALKYSVSRLVLMSVPGSLGLVNPAMRLFINAVKKLIQGGQKKEPNPGIQSWQVVIVFPTVWENQTGSEAEWELSCELWRSAAAEKQNDPLANPSRDPWVTEEYSSWHYGSLNSKLVSWNSFHTRQQISWFISFLNCESSTNCGALLGQLGWL